ncbi:MAG: alpha/beta fold hydrolase [Acidobacteria bacterium]|nr:alpha/beta fold hydrolase [Acidobacteriota bacterium]
MQSLVGPFGPRSESVTAHGLVPTGDESVRLFERTVGRREHQFEIAPQSFVFLHGLGGTHRYWSAADGESHLPSGSILVDLLGFGRSPRPFTRYTLDSHLAALEPVLENRAPSILIGHSLGAALALVYAARHPNQVTGLVLISLPSYGGASGAFRWFRRRLRGWFLTNMVLTALVCVATRRLLGPILPMVIRDIPPEVARDLVEHNFMSSTTSLWNVHDRPAFRRSRGCGNQPFRVVWLAAMVLLVAAGVAVITRRAWWRPIALIGALVSQVVVFLWWGDALCGNDPQRSHFGVGRVRFSARPVHQRCWGNVLKSRTIREFEALLACPDDDRVFSEADLKGLPQPVRRYLSSAIAPGTPRLRWPDLPSRPRGVSGGCSGRLLRGGECRSVGDGHTRPRSVGLHVLGLDQPTRSRTRPV